MFSHTFYINDLDNLCSKASAINLIEHIINEAYKREMNSFVDAMQKLQMTKIPKVFCIYRQQLTNDIIVDKVHLETIKDKDLIVEFKNPKWENSLENTLKDLGLKSTSL
jgi:hypothetical protein